MEYVRSKPIGKGPGGATPGYLDQEISPGVYIVEVRKIGGYQFIATPDNAEHTFITFWKRRAGELCPNGYSGEPRWIRPMEAQIDQYRCDANFCQNYPMVTGTVTCKSN
jgi:hypothetical protein